MTMGNMTKSVIPNNALQAVVYVLHVEHMKKAAALSFQNDLLTDSTWPSQVVVTIETHALSTAQCKAGQR